MVWPRPLEICFCSSDRKHDEPGNDLISMIRSTLAPIWFDFAAPAMLVEPERKIFLLEPDFRKACQLEIREVLRLPTPSTSQHQPPARPAMPQRRQGVDKARGTFMVHIVPERDESTLGLVLDLSHPEICLVKDIVDGLISDWNDECFLDEVVKPGDHIVAVNGELVDSSSITRCFVENTSRQTSFCVRRPEERRLVLEHPGTLCTPLSHNSSSVGLFVGAIHEGCVFSRTDIAPGDRIVAINEQIMDAAAIESKLKDFSSSISITILRYHPV
jgi:hypothetical protein